MSSLSITCPKSCPTTNTSFISFASTFSVSLKKVLCGLIEFCLLVLRLIISLNINFNVHLINFIATTSDIQVFLGKRLLLTVQLIMFFQMKTLSRYTPVYYSNKKVASTVGFLMIIKVGMHAFLNACRSIFKPEVLIRKPPGVLQGTTPNFKLPNKIFTGVRKLPKQLCIARSH